MKSWNLSDDLRRDSSLSRIVDAMRGVVEEAIGPTADLVQADWSIRTDKSGKKGAVLRISDWTCAEGVETTFTPEDLASPTQARRKIHWLWGDLLQARNHQQLRELQAEGV